MHSSFWSGFGTGLILLTYVVGLGVVGCGCAGEVKVGPFMPANPRYCSSDVQCGDHERCWFPGVDTRAVCMPGKNEAMPVLPGADVR